MDDTLLTPDTQATLLLCGSFTAADSPDFKPLSPGEYNALALWLQKQNLRPADLLSRDPPTGEDLPEPQRVRDLLGRGVQMAAALERWQNLGLTILGRSDPRYPERLRRTLRAAAPPLLFTAGDLSAVDAGGLAIVGSRETDDEGLDFTRRVAERFTEAGVPILSGGAKGVDQVAVASALEAGGTAIVVLAERLDRAATARDARPYLREGRLILLSPWMPEASFTAGRAMGRNKDIHALADAALVVRFLADRGGSRAGVVDRLSRNRPGAQVPVYVRVRNNPPEGVADLLQRGAMPFPEETFETTDVRLLLSEVTRDADSRDA